MGSEAINGGSADWPLLFMGISGMWTRTTLAKTIKSGKDVKNLKKLPAKQASESPLCRSVKHEDDCPISCLEIVSSCLRVPVSDICPRPRSRHSIPDNQRNYPEPGHQLNCCLSPCLHTMSLVSAHNTSNTSNVSICAYKCPQHRHAAALQHCAAPSNVALLSAQHCTYGFIKLAEKIPTRA